MDFFDIVAILAALAWIPWVIHWVLKPRLSISTHEDIEISYDIDGPKLNILFAFSTERKDCLIEKIELTLKHENEETHHFYWNWFEEELVQMEVPGVGSVP